MKQTLSVDFDGTIVDHAFPLIGGLKPGVKEAITKLKEKYTIVISSCRASQLFNRGKPNKYVEEMRKFLDDNDIPYDRIDEGDEGKIVAVAYIDDRGIRYQDNWAQIAESLT